MLHLTLYLLGMILPVLEGFGSTSKPFLDKGAIYVMPYLIESNCLIKNLGPKHSFYAMTSDSFFNILPDDDLNTTTPKWLHQALLTEMPDLVKTNHRRTIVDTETAIALAKRMIGMKFRYRYIRCNCRHYVDYLKYGKTFGRWWDFSYYLMSEDCPLYAPFTSDSKVNTEEFTLYDKHKNPAKLAPLNRQVDPPSASVPDQPQRLKSQTSNDSSYVRFNSDSSSDPSIQSTSPARRRSTSSPTRRRFSTRHEKGSSPTLSPSHSRSKSAPSVHLLLNSWSSRGEV